MALINLLRSRLQSGFGERGAKNCLQLHALMPKRPRKFAKMQLPVAGLLREVLDLHSLRATVAASEPACANGCTGERKNKGTSMAQTGNQRRRFGIHALHILRRGEEHCPAKQTFASERAACQKASLLLRKTHPNICDEAIHNPAAAPPPPLHSAGELVRPGAHDPHSRRPAQVSQVATRKVGKAALSKV